MTSNPTISPWLSKLNAVLREDPRKAGILGVLTLVLLVVGARALLRGDGGPKRASGAVGAVNPAAAAAPSKARVRGAGSRAGSGAGADSSSSSRTPQPANSYTRLREWMAEPVRPVTRNLFAVKLEYFPPDGSRASQGVKTAADGEFWGRLEKSLTLQADQRDKRENLLANFRTEAGKLRLDSTIMGEKPKALIDGKLVAEGDVVASFRVLKIEPRRIIVEREGIRLEIQMK